MVATLTNRAVTTILVASANQNISSGDMEPISAKSDSLHFAKPGRTEESGVLNHDWGMSAPDQQRRIHPLAIHAVCPLHLQQRPNFSRQRNDATCQLQTFRAPFESSQCIRQI